MLLLRPDTALLPVLSVSRCFVGINDSLAQVLIAFVPRYLDARASPSWCLRVSVSSFGVSVIRCLYLAFMFKHLRLGTSYAR